MWHDFLILRLFNDIFPHQHEEIHAVLAKNSGSENAFALRMNSVLTGTYAAT